MTLRRFSLLTGSLLAAAVATTGPMACSNGGSDDDAASGGDGGKGGKAGDSGNGGMGGEVGGQGDSAGAGGMGGDAGASGGMGGGGAGGVGGVAPATPQLFAYVGGGNATLATIRWYKYDIAAGTLMAAAKSFNTGYKAAIYLAAHPAGKALYASSEGGSQVRAMLITPGTGDLVGKDPLETAGRGAIHTSVHPTTGKWLFVANYVAGNVNVFPIKGDGDLGASVDMPITNAGANQVMSTPDGKYVFVPTRGDTGDHPNSIFQFSFNAETGKLTPSTPATVQSDDPRHMAFSKDSKFGYLVNEKPADDKPSTVIAYSQDGGKLTQIQSIEMNAAEKSASHIEVHPNGKFLFAAGRNTSSIYTFAIGTDGKLTAAGSFDANTIVEVPRDFTIDSEGNHLIVASQDSTANVIALKVNKETGALTQVGVPVTGPIGPSSVVITQVPGK